MQPDEKKEGVWIILLMIFNAVLDFFSVASFLPLLVVIVNPALLSTRPDLKRVYDFFQFSSSASFVMFFAAAILALVVVKNLVSAWIAGIKMNYIFKVGNGISSRSFGYYLEMSYGRFSQSDFSRELNRITNYPLAFSNNILLPSTILVSEGFVAMLIMAGITFYNYKLAVILFIIMLPVLALYRSRRKKLKELSMEINKKYPQYTKYALQGIEGFSEIKAFGKENFFYDRFRKVSQQITQVSIKDQLIQSGTLRLTEIIVTVVFCCLIVYAVTTQQQYQQTLVMLGIYAGAAFRIVPSLNRILQCIQQIKIHEHLLGELKTAANYVYTRPASGETLPFHTTIELKDISFCYADGRMILNGVEMLIEKGQKIAVTGKSGEGKTTFLMILLRFLKETGGELRVDNKIVHDERGWRALIGYVPQNPYMVDGTIAENIGFGIPGEEIDKTKAQQLILELDLAEMVSRLPDGMNTIIGERGVKISGGQRQRIAIARALYANAEILLLDEITNQVHARMEEEILNILNKLANKNKTIIMVTHKLPRISFFDSIYNLEKGKLVQASLQPR